MVSRYLAVVGVILLLEIHPVPANLFTASGRAKTNLVNTTKERPEWQTETNHVDDMRLRRSRPFVPFNSLTFSTDSLSSSSSFSWVPPNVENIRQKIANSKLAGKKPELLKPVAVPPAPAAMVNSSPSPRPSSLVGLTNYSRPDAPHQSWDDIGTPSRSPQATQNVFNNPDTRTPASTKASTSKWPPPTTTVRPTLYTWSTVSNNEVTKTPPPFVRPPHMSILHTMKPSSFAVSLPSVVIGVARPSSPRPFSFDRPSSSPARPPSVILLPPIRASQPPPTRASTPPPTKAPTLPPTRLPPPPPTRFFPPQLPTTTRLPPPSPTRLTLPPLTRLPLPTRRPPQPARSPPPPRIRPPQPPTRLPPPQPARRPPPTTTPTPAVASILTPVGPPTQPTQSPALVSAVTWFPPPQVFTFPSTTPPVSSAQGIVTWFPPYTKLSPANSSDMATTSKPGSFSLHSSFPSTPLPPPPGLATSKLTQSPVLKYHARPGILRPSIITWRPSYEPIIVKQPSTLPQSGGLLVTFTPRPLNIVQEDTTLSPPTPLSKPPPLKSSTVSFANNYPFRIQTQWNSFSQGLTRRPPIRLTKAPGAVTPTPAPLVVQYASAQAETQNIKKGVPHTPLTRPSPRPLPGTVTILPGDSQVLQQVLKDMTDKEDTVMVKKTSSTSQLTQRPSVNSHPPAELLTGGYLVNGGVSGLTNQEAEMLPEKQGVVNSGVSPLLSPISAPVVTTTASITTQTSSAANPYLTSQSTTSATTAPTSLPSAPYWYTSPSGATHPLPPSTNLPPLHHTHTSVFASPGTSLAGIPTESHQGMPHHHPHTPPTAQEGPGTMAAGMGGTHPELGPHVLVKVWSAEGGRFTLVSSGRVPSHALASNNIPDLQFTSSPPPLHFPYYTFQYPKTQPTSPQSGSLGPLSKPALTFPSLPSVFPPHPSPLPTRLPLTTSTHTQQETKDALTHTPLPYASLNTKELLEVLKLKLLTQDSSQDRPQNHAHPWHLDGGITQSPVMSSTLSQGAQVTKQPAYGSLGDPPRLGDPLNQTDFLHKPVLIVRGNDSSSDSQPTLPTSSSSTKDTIGYSYYEAHHYFSTITPDFPPRPPSSPTHHPGIQLYAPLYSGLLPQTLQRPPPAATNATSLESFNWGSQYSSLIQDFSLYESQNVTLATDSPASTRPSSHHYTSQTVSVPPPTTVVSSSTPGLTLPISNLLENSIKLSNILEELRQDLPHSNSTLGHQETLPLQDGGVSLTNNIMHLKDYFPPSSATPVSHETLINPLFPPLLPILFGHSFSLANLTSGFQNTSSGTHYEIPPTSFDISVPSKHSVEASMNERPLSSAIATNNTYSFPHFSPGLGIITNTTTAPRELSTITTPTNALTSGLPGDSVTTESTSPPQASISHPTISTQSLVDLNTLKKSSLFFPDWRDNLDVKQTSYHVSHAPSHRQPSKYVTPSSVSLHSSVAPSPELFEVLTNLQHSLRSPTTPFRPHLSNLTNKNEFVDFPVYLNDFKNHSSLSSVGQHFSPSDVDDMESEYQAGISSWTPSGPSSGEPAWEDLLQPSYLEALLTDLDMEDPHIRTILRTLAMIYIFAINPHLHILNLQDNHNESLSSAQVSTSHLSSTTKPITLNSFNPEQEGNKSALLNEVFLPHPTLQKNNFRSPYQAEVTPSTAPLKDDSLFSRIEATVPADGSTSSGSSELTREKSRMEECLKKTWCALGVALTMAAGTTSAVAVPLMMPLMGRRRKKLPFAPISRRGPHLAPRLSLAANTDSRLRRSPNTMLAATLRRMTYHNHKNCITMDSIGGRGSSRQESGGGVVFHMLETPSISKSLSSSDKVLSHSKSFISASQDSGLKEVDNTRSF